MKEYIDVEGLYKIQQTARHGWIVVSAAYDTHAGHHHPYWRALMEREVEVEHSRIEEAPAGL